MPDPTAAPSIRGVLFDVHHTLLHAGDAGGWLQAAWTTAGRAGGPADTMGAPAYGQTVAFLDRLWEHARAVDPDSTRDLDPRRHRAVFDQTIAGAPAVDAGLAGALYASLPDQWQPYEDVIPVLRALRDDGIRVAALSNVGYDLDPVLRATGLAALLDGVVVSHEVGAVKPDPAIFRRGLEVLGLPAEEVLMVGDAWRDDSAAAALGVRTLILPRTDGPTHGLELVVRLVTARS